MKKAFDHIGFITTEPHGEVAAKMRGKGIWVFIPTTPNPTSGFLVLVPEDKVVTLEMSVADGVKHIVSLGSITPAYVAAPSAERTVPAVGLTAGRHD